MYKRIKYLKHLLTATTQHGVHSPFIYNYITKCLYGKPNYKTSKNVEVLLKSVHYFSAKHIKIISKNTTITDRIAQEFNLKSNEYPPYDIIYFEDVSKIIKLITKKDIVHNDTLIICNNTYKNKTHTLLWKNIKQLKEVTVTIDLFYCGVIFFRKEQAKEHFKIRI